MHHLLLLDINYVGNLVILFIVVNLENYWLDCMINLTSADRGSAFRWWCFRPLLFCNLVQVVKHETMNVKHPCLSLYTAAFVLMCFAGVAWNVYEFYLNKDLILIQLKTFHSSTDELYPSLTFCFARKHFFVDNRFKRPRNGRRSRIKHIHGSTRRILNVEDYISSMEITDIYERTHTYSRHNKIGVNSLSINAVFRHYKDNCFALDIPFSKDKKITSLTVKVRRSISVGRKLVMAGGSSSVGLLYHTQFYNLSKTFSNSLDVWRKNENNSQMCYSLAISITQLEVMKKRNMIIFLRFIPIYPR